MFFGAFRRGAGRTKPYHANRGKPFRADL